MPLIQLLVRIGADGTVTAETRNVAGVACLDYIDLLEEVLGATTTDSVYTADYARSQISDIEEARNELGRS